uniref:Serine/threonine-protein kinase PLK n=1 Tax=Lynceus sp. MCZ IZ 141354 TaxID=1930659 RepID=A0A9N6WR07_9CRUS|nr:EOG090X03P9 [Lynceus sp. MCZ IZ 141354]
MSLKPNTDPPKQDIPDILHDPKTKKRYQRGRLLGKGGFAKCYELRDLESKNILAGKIVSKQLLLKQHQKEKMSQEIAIHASLDNSHIVGFHNFFEDSNFVYIILELCPRRSLMELHKRRKAITEPEARYFMRQLLLGVNYLHLNKIIHRDLKLGNLFLNDEMELKVGDFGLATRVEYDGERKRTLCGTPNYIAPEVLNKKGHSYEVDVWSIGCILYTLLVGRPPFETQSLKETYSKIKKNEYHIPSRVGQLAAALIRRMLHSEPNRRPSVAEILADDFMTLGYLPSRLPVSCLITAPRFDTKHNASLVAVRKPLGDINKENVAAQNAVAVKKDSDDVDMDAVATGAGVTSPTSSPSKVLLKDLQQQLSKLLGSRGKRPENNLDDAEDPAAIPMVWISKWVDYSDKYGFGYQLSDDSIGVIFNDLTKLLLLADGKNIHYIERDGSEHYHTTYSYPSTLDKKVKLLNYFHNYMTEHLLRAGAAVTPREGDELSRIPFLHQWFRTSRAVVMYLSNGTLQINFFKDHTKIILCPLLSAVTYIDEGKNFRTFRMNLLEEHGCTEDLFTRLQYAYEKINYFLTQSKV